MASLLDLPGVTTTTAHFGAFGAETADGQPIKKAVQIMSNYNFPGLHRDFGKRLSATDLLYCTPIHVNLTAATQTYPDAFVDQLLTSIKGWISQHEPQRFGYFTVYALARPTFDTAAWDNVFKQVEKSFVGSARRPYIVDPDSTFGKEIQDLFRMDAVRIQVAHTPRRFHSDIPHLARGAAFQHADGSRLVEVEQLDEVRRPKGPFSKPVQYAVFIYGSSRQADESQRAAQDDPGPEVPISGLPTDITFPGCDKIPISVRRSVARLHTNLGHPSAQELNRLLCHRGVPSSGVQECVRKLSCATCQRLAGPQQPRPSSTPSLQAGHFGDLVQGDFFWVRLLSGASAQVLGLADTATGYQQAAILRNKSAKDAYDLLHSAWLRPYGLPVRLRLDPDPLFQGEFEVLLSNVNVNVEYCPAEAHWVIGTVKRRNCVLRSILEKLINDHAVDDTDRLDYVLTAALHALNSFVTVKGRSPYQAVYGKVPRIPGGLLTDGGSLAQCVGDPGLAAERVRSEAVSHLAAMNVNQGLKRAILRKTANTKIPDLQPGQRVAFWRWRRRGLRRRGAWTTGRFLAYDPSYPGKQCWIRSGNSTILVAMEKVRNLEWTGWIADAATAFLIAGSATTGRTQPTTLHASTIGRADSPDSSLEIHALCHQSNIYGLANAPRLWSIEVVTRLLNLGYAQHSLDRMVFMKRNASGELVSLIIVYVDDFLGVYRKDYNIAGVHGAFVWGALNYFKNNEPLTFKGKELTLKLNNRGRYILTITQKEFISGLDSGKLPEQAWTSLLLQNNKASYALLPAVYSGFMDKADQNMNNFGTPYRYVRVCFESGMHTRVQ